MKTLAELSQSLRVAERVIACTEPNCPAVLALIRRSIARDCIPLSFGGQSPLHDRRRQRLAEIHAQIAVVTVQQELDLQPVSRYVPREIAPTAENLALPMFFRIQAD
jgi:hypothetical protein